MGRLRTRAMAAAAALLALSVTLSCGARQPLRGQVTDSLDRKLSTFAFIEEGDLVSFIVDTRATRYRAEMAYIPLEICVANRGLRQLILTRESFTLIDENGKRYPAASPSELIQNYEFLDLDRNALAELEGIIFNRFAAFTRYPSKFSPTRDVQFGRSSLVRDMISLPRFGYMLDFVYFPQPETGLMGKTFELHMDSENLEDAVFVKFLVK